MAKYADIALIVQRLMALLIDILENKTNFSIIDNSMQKIYFLLIKINAETNLYKLKKICINTYQNIKN